MNIRPISLRMYVILFYFILFGIGISASEPPQAKGAEVEQKYINMLVTNPLKNHVVLVIIDERLGRVVYYGQTNDGKGLIYNSLKTNDANLDNFFIFLHLSPVEVWHQKISSGHGVLVKNSGRVLRLSDLHNMDSGENNEMQRLVVTRTSTAISPPEEHTMLLAFTKAHMQPK